MRKPLIISLLLAAPLMAQNKPKSFDEKAEQLADENAKKERDKRELRVPELKLEDKEKFDKRDKIVVQTTGVSDYERFRRSKQLQIESKRMQLIDDLKGILAQKPPDADKPDLFFQMAELYL